MAAPQHSDVKARLRDIINDHSTAKVKDGKYQHAGDSYVDHDGDGTEGNVTYYCKNNLCQAPYELGSTKGGNIAGAIDFESAKNVVPVTSYVPEAEDHENYTAMESARVKYAGKVERWALIKGELYTELPEYHERYISQKTRDNMDSSDFAGKGTSFPIKSQQDVSAALHSIGRAGAGNYSGDTIRANIKKIAKRKGYTLPDSLKDSTSEGARGSSSRADGTGAFGRRESGSGQRERAFSSPFDDFTTAYAVENRGTLRSTWKPEGTLLLESSATFCEAPRLAEAASSTFPIKLMSPGRGSSGYYPPDTLRKAAESNVFGAGTHMFWNHDTDAEEAARPEGDLNRLAAVTTTPAKWMENGHDGPGLYAHAKVFADYAEKVKEMGPHIGLSIRAGGDRDEAAKGPDGKPRVITALRNAASVDFVTKAGRDGKIFTESATREGEDMDKNEVQALIRESLAPIQAENKALKEMLAATRGPVLIGKHLDGIRLPAKVKERIVEALAYSIPLDAAGQVDDAKLKTLVEAKAKEWAELLPALGYSENPAALGTRVTEAELLPMAEALDKQRAEVFEGLADLFVGKKLTKGAVDEDKRQMRKQAREAFVRGEAA